MMVYHRAAPPLPREDPPPRMGGGEGWGWGGKGRREAVIGAAGAALSEDALRAFCQGQIAHYKIPRYIKFVATFPMTVTGKVQKYLIRDQMKQELKLSEAKTA